MSFPRYPEYKDSGVEWLGEVPAHWETWKVAHAFGSIGSGTTPPSSEEHWYDEVGMPWVTTGELRENIIVETNKSVTTAALEKFSALRIHPAGSLVVAMYGATIGRLGILGVDAVTNQACCVLSAPRSLSIAFTYYWLQGFKQIIIDLFSTGGGQPNINQDTVANLRIPAPGLGDQTAIATFLDRETAKIDALVAEQEKLIALLQEKRQAVISHAVTKGLDPNVPMKDSGVEWLGEVPGHWEILKISHAFRARKGRDAATLTKEHCATIEGEYPVYSGQTENSGVMASISSFEFDTGNSGVLFSTTVGAKAMTLMHINGRFSLSQNCMIISASTDLDMRFYFYHFQPLFAYERGLIPEHMQASFRMEDLYAYRFARPSVNEQIEIARYLDEKCSGFDRLISESQKNITLLQERRTALISAAVTGQIDVRGLAGGTNTPDLIAASAYPASARG